MRNVSIPLLDSTSTPKRNWKLVTSLGWTLAAFCILVVASHVTLREDEKAVGGLMDMLKKKGPARPVAVITDIGRDIDDALFMLALSGFAKDGKANPVGFVTTGFNEVTVQKRMGLLKWWVARLGLGTPQITGCVSGQKDEEVFLPAGVLPDNTFKDDKCAAAADMLLQLSDYHSGQLEVFAIAGMGALKVALERAEAQSKVLNLASVWIQGQWKASGTNIEPEFKAYNLNIDQEASNAVFSKLAPTVPMRLLGKWAAYQTKIMVQDFQVLNQLDPSSDILETALAQINTFRKNVPWLMWHLYPGKWNDNPRYALGMDPTVVATPLPKSESEAQAAMGKPYPDDNSWCEQLTYISMPYDPCLILWAFSDDIYSPQAVGIHQVVGNDQDHPDVPNPQKSHDGLMAAMAKGLKGATQEPNPPSTPRTCPLLHTAPPSSGGMLSKLFGLLKTKRSSQTSQ